MAFRSAGLLALLRLLFVEKSLHRVDRILLARLSLAAECVLQKPGSHSPYVGHELRVRSCALHCKWNGAHSTKVGTQFEREFIRRTHHAGSGNHSDGRNREI